MVGNSATKLAWEFQKTEWRRHDSDMKPQRGRSIDGPSLRGLWGRSATGQNGQAAANKEVSAVWSGGGWMSENISGVPAGRSVFHLTSPFIGPSFRSISCGSPLPVVCVVLLTWLGSTDCCIGRS